MNCLICNSSSDYYFSKTYSEPPYDVFMREVGEVKYHKCPNCGFVLSKTHAEMDTQTWSDLNYKTHTFHEDSTNQDNINQPPYAEQAMMLMILGKKGIINTESMLDYAAGYGTLSKILSGYFNMELPIFDEYVTEDINRYIPKKELGTYKTVLNSAMFEHILTREDLDKVDKLVDNDGCLILHTLICENIPKDPGWFYLRPPLHTAFHTNNSMNLLMSQWGYQSSIYCPKAKSWVLLKKDDGNIEVLVKLINEELQTNYLYYKKGFVDYWKGF